MILGVRDVCSSFHTLRLLLIECSGISILPPEESRRRLWGRYSDVSMGKNNKVCGRRVMSSFFTHLAISRRNGDSSFNYPGYSISSTFRHLPETRNLVKQTYSVHVHLPADRAKSLTRKWHLSMSSIHLRSRCPDHDQLLTSVKKRRTIYVLWT